MPMETGRIIIDVSTHTPMMIIRPPAAGEHIYAVVSSYRRMQRSRASLEL
jgi:hypothetical protein